LVDECKKSTGKKLHSDPIISDANCTKVCVYMSVVLLASSLIYELTGFAYADVIGAAGLIYFSVSEGKEAFEKAKGKAATAANTINIENLCSTLSKIWFVTVVSWWCNRYSKVWIIRLPDFTWKCGNKGNNKVVR
jgi:divalent metal cation (Fe/Co/Zn/Cd) transporter